MAETPATRAGTRGILKSPLDLAGGLFLVALAMVGLFGSLDLRFGQLSSVGPGLVPRSVAVLIGVFGLGLALTSFLSAGPRLEQWHFRGAFFVLGAVVVFALTIRGSTLSLGDWKITIPQLGLVIAGPLAVIISALADRETRPMELLVFTVVVTVVCIGVFRYVLGLPIPIMPFGYGPF